MIFDILLWWVRMSLQHTPLLPLKICTSRLESLSEPGIASFGDMPHPSTNWTLKAGPHFLSSVVRTSQPEKI